VALSDQKRTHGKCATHGIAIGRAVRGDYNTLGAAEKRFEIGKIGILNKRVHRNGVLHGRRR
jgi:hypothetical protein